MERIQAEPEYCFIQGPKDATNEHEWIIWGRMMKWAHSAIVQVIEHDLTRGWCRCRLVGIDASILGYTLQKELQIPYSWLAPTACVVLESNKFYCIHGYYGSEVKVCSLEK